MKPTDHIAIIGDGRLAFMIAQVLALSGSNLTIVGRHQTKLDQFRSFAKTVLEAEVLHHNNLILLLRLLDLQVV